MDNTWVLTKDKHTIWVEVKVPTGKEQVGDATMYKNIMKNLGVGTGSMYTAKYGSKHQACFGITCTRHQQTSCWVLREDKFRISVSSKIPQYDKKEMQDKVRASKSGGWLKKLLNVLPDQDSSLDQSNISQSSQSSEVPPTQQPDEEDEFDVDIGGQDNISPILPTRVLGKDPALVENKDMSDLPTQLLLSDDSDDNDDDLTSKYSLVFCFIEL